MIDYNVELKKASMMIHDKRMPLKPIINQLGNMMSDCPDSLKHIAQSILIEAVTRLEGFPKNANKMDKDTRSKCICGISY